MSRSLTRSDGGKIRMSSITIVSISPVVPLLIALTIRPSSACHISGEYGMLGNDSNGSVY